MQLANNSRLCIALDVPDTVDKVAPFIHTVLDATRDLVGAYKINPAFFLRYGDTGRRMFDVIVHHAHHAEVPVIFDAKYGDVPHTNEKYAEFVFDDLGVDAVTVNPYVGFDSLMPFMCNPDKTVFVLSSMSGPRSYQYQDTVHEDRIPMAVQVAIDAGETNEMVPAQIGLVMGTRFTDLVGETTACAPTLPLLIPGLGAQGGVYVDVPNGIYVYGRSIMDLYSDSGPDWPVKMRAKAEELNEQSYTARPL